MVSDRARLTLLAPDLADLHENTPGATCLLAPDGDTCCPNPATHRVTFEPLPGHAGAVTFACAEHVPDYLSHPAVQAIREVRPHAH
jgi:hypothetical protein